MSTSLIIALGVIVAASLLIMVACDSFEEASSYLGRNLPPGVRGASINAVGSSLPELLTATFFLFVHQDHDGFAAGIATCAGSAVFNAVIIPAVAIIAVTLVGQNVDGRRVRVPGIEVAKSTIWRDGLFLLVAEGALVWVLAFSELTWMHGAGLLFLYGLYFAFLMLQIRRGRGQHDAEEDDDDDDDEPVSFLRGLVTLDVNRVLFADRPLSTGSAWTVLGVATLFIAVACYFLSEAVINVAVALDVPTYFTAVILAAAATSVPDTVLSVKDAMAGDYDDAVSNALGSNIFDITVGLGLPIFLYGLSHGVIGLAGSANVEDVRTLQIALVAITALVIGVFVAGKKVGVAKAVALALLYVGWTVFVLDRALGWGLLA